MPAPVLVMIKGCVAVALTPTFPKEIAVVERLTEGVGTTVRVVCPLTVPEVAVIVVAPRALVEANPLLPIVADVVLEVHVAVAVKFCCVPSVKVPVAVNCTDSPSATEALAGVIATETSVAGPTVRIVEPLTVPDVAKIVVDPWEALEAKPVLLIGATVAAEELQVARAVRSWIEPSE